MTRLQPLYCSKCGEWVGTVVMPDLQTASARPRTHAPARKSKGGKGT